MKPLFKLAGATTVALEAAGRTGSNLAKSVFKKTASTARATFDASRVKNDVLVKSARVFGSESYRAGRGIGKASRYVSDKSSQYVRRQWNKLPSTVRKGTVGTARIGSTLAGIGALGVGAAGMMSVGIMNGMNNAAKDILLERYMQDQRYSRNMLLQSRVGLSMGTSNMNRLGSTSGLSNALSKTRHGATY